MKKLTALFILLLAFTSAINAQIRNVIVEKYYVSDALDATDSINWQTDTTYQTRFLPVGSKTYRIYVQIDSGYKIHKIYGTSNHPLKFISTANFFNNISWSTYYFGYMIKKTKFNGTPTLALDSWLTLGLCGINNSGSVKYNGVLKPDDHDGSFIVGNGGGTAGIAGGILINNDTSAHIAIDTADGMIPASGVFSGWVNNGFMDTAGNDTTALGSKNVGSKFINTNGYLQQNSGVSGDSATGHKVLVAQLTTTGDITFEINLELMDSTGTGIHYFNFVADNHNQPTTGDTVVSALLKYPPVCGCKDPNYLEYNANYTCGSPDSCHTHIIFGCMDTLACNYDATANFNIPTLCCYPGNCNDRDISLVCPGIASNSALSVFPNPASSQVTIQIYSGNSQEIKYVIYNSFGTSVIETDLGSQSGSITQQVDVSNLQVGLYLVRVYIGGSSDSKTFMKN